MSMCEMDLDLSNPGASISLGQLAIYSKRIREATDMSGNLSNDEQFVACKLSKLIGKGGIACSLVLSSNVRLVSLKRLLRPAGRL
jgi:hypothetical protein